MKIAPHTFEFIKRWQKKGRDNYPMNDWLSNYFDRFFTAFVLYNFLYNLLSRELQLTSKKEKERATIPAKDFLTGKTIFEEPSIIENGNDILDFIRRKEFYFRNEDLDWKSEPVKKMESSIPDEWTTGLLEIIYVIRCNMFHGDKEFIGNQRRILTPCIRVIEQLNKLIVTKLETNAGSPPVCQ